MNKEKASAYATRPCVEQMEERNDFASNFDVEGLIPCVTTDAKLA